MKAITISIKIILLVLLLTSLSSAQFKVGTGGYLGGGTIKGQSLSIGTFTASAFVETNNILFLEVSPRLSIIYARDFNALLPNTSKPYLPYMWGVNLKGITTQYFENRIFLEEGIGLLALNDRTFSDTDSWSYGVVLSLSGGWDLRGFDLDGFKIGGGIEYGITFNNTLAQYSSLHIYFTYSL